MARTASLRFPFRVDPVNGGLERNDTVEKTLTSAIKSFLLTDKNSRMGNPKGCTLPSMIQNTYTEETLGFAQDEILSELEKQFPEVKILEFTLFNIDADLYVRTKYFTTITDIVSFEFKV